MSAPSSHAARGRTGMSPIITASSPCSSHTASSMIQHGCSLLDYSHHWVPLPRRAPHCRDRCQGQDSCERTSSSVRCCEDGWKSGVELAYPKSAFVATALAASAADCRGERGQSWSRNASKCKVDSQKWGRAGMTPSRRNLFSLQAARSPAGPLPIQAFLRGPVTHTIHSGPRLMSLRLKRLI